MIREQVIQLLREEKAEACNSGKGRTVQFEGTTIAVITVSLAHDREPESFDENHLACEWVAFVRLTQAGIDLVGRGWGAALHPSHTTSRQGIL